MDGCRGYGMHRLTLGRYLESLLFVDGGCSIRDFESFLYIERIGFGFIKWVVRAEEKAMVSNMQEIITELRTSVE
jgi:hypothetical protein